MMNPNVAPAGQQYDRVRFAHDYLSPGLCVIEGGGLTNKWDIRAGHGIIGGEAWFVGTELSEFAITFRLYETQDWEDWNRIAPIFRTRQKTEAWKGLDVEHPILKEVGITACVVKKVNQPVLEDETGVWSIRVEFIEYPRKPQLKVAKVEATQAQAVDPIKDAMDAKTKAIADRLKKLGLGDLAPGDAGPAIL